MTIRKVIILLSLLFPISTLIERYFTISNKLLFVLLLGLLIVDITKIKKIDLAFLAFFAMCYSVSMYFTEVKALMININMAMYFPFMILFYIWFMQNDKQILKDMISMKRVIFGIVMFFSVILVVSMVFPSSYIVIGSGGWGDTKYFASFSNSPNRMGPACFFIEIIILFLLMQNMYKNILVLLFLPLLYAAFACGSRTYFVLILCGFLAFWYLRFWKATKKNNWKFWITLIPLIILASIIFLNSNIYEKVIISLSNVGSGNTHEFWRRLTNSRSVFWVEQIKGYFDFDFIHKLFGHGVNWNSYTVGIWAHNDFIEILISYGLLGLASYIFLMIKLFRNSIKKELPFFLKTVVIFMWIFNAFFNFFYCYYCSALGYVYLILVVKMISQQIIPKYRSIYGSCGFNVNL